MQTDTDTGSSQTRAAGGLRGLARDVRGSLPILAMAAAAFGADQITKRIARDSLRVGESWPPDGFFRFTHGTNSGTAFGLFPDQTLLLTIASVIAIGFIIYFHRAHGGRDWISKLTIGLLLGGAFGNLIDRVVAGEVTDFIDVGPWPIFNLADSSIVVGIVLLVARLLLWGGEEGRGGGEAAAHAGADGGGDGEIPREDGRA